MPFCAGNDILATHSVVRVVSLDAITAALARRGTPLAGTDLMILRGGMRAALIANGMEWFERNCRAEGVRRLLQTVLYRDFME